MRSMAEGLTGLRRLPKERPLPFQGRIFGRPGSRPRSRFPASSRKANLPSKKGE